MRKWIRGLAVVCVLVATQVVTGQESVGPIQIGGGSSGRITSNNQTVEVTATGVSVTIYFTEVSALRVTGNAVRTSGGTSAGTVTVRWVNRSQQVILTVGPTNPDVPFGMENGDVDKRSGGDVSP